MREIKFRAWNDIHQKMYLDLELFSLLVEGDNDSIEFEDTHFMQYTGLKDKNGKEIYEGDVIKTSLWNINTEIRFENGGFRGGPLHLEQYMDSPTLEVIGNIYENPELLKSK